MLKVGILILCVIHYLHSSSDSPGCPIWLNNKPNPGFPACSRYRNQCNSDKECKQGQLCFSNPSCGKTCQAPVSRCRPVCAIACPFGNVMDANNCPTCVCKTGSACEKGTPQGTCKIGPFPSKPCPSGTCCLNSVCCKIPCDYGDPHPTRFCGMVVSSNKCPIGYHCKGGPFEYHACCPNAKTTI